MLENYWPFWYGGIGIAFVAIFVLSLGGYYLSITRGYVSACSIFSKKPYFNRPEMGGAFGFRTCFILGVCFGGFLAAIYSQSLQPSWSLGVFEKIWGNSLLVKAVVLLSGGFLWGYGARMARGCTSGNSISGISRGSWASVVTSICFLLGGSAITHVLYYLVGGLP